MQHYAPTSLYLVKQTVTGLYEHVYEVPAKGTAAVQCAQIAKYQQKVCQSENAMHRGQTVAAICRTRDDLADLRDFINVVVASSQCVAASGILHASASWP